VHHSHYGRICPIETPEGPNIGLIGSLATFGRINDYGFIETPYRKVYSAVENNADKLTGHTLRENVSDAEGNLIAGTGTLLTAELAQKIAALPARQVRILPFVSDEIAYLSADEEDHYYVAQANSRLNEQNELIGEQVEARYAQQFIITTVDRIQYMDVSPKQVFSVATALIPFLEHDDANRALMGANMQRQAVPLIRPESPLVGTGIEWQAARDSGQVILSAVDGEVSSVTAKEIIVTDAEGNQHKHKLHQYVRSNQGTSITQRPIVDVGDKVIRSQALADSSSTENGELALGQNVLVAFMSWDGGNFEDAIILSEQLVRDDKFTSVHIEKHEVEARDTKLGPEEITRDIPNVGDEALRDLDENGIIRIGAEVGPADILVGKITPKGETELTAEERLLRAIFGEKAREVKDTSLRVPHGERGKVVDVRVFSRDNHDELPAGVNQLVRVSIAQKRKISEGDKMAGRHGNKGVISMIKPVEDLPFLPDGTPVDIVLNPIGVPSRMNVGQILETHLGTAAAALGVKYASHVFDGAKEYAIEDALSRAWIISRALKDSTAGGAPHMGNVDSKMPIVNEWLEKEGYDAKQVMQGNIGGLATNVCYRLWMKDHGVDTTDIPDNELFARAQKLEIEKHDVLPTSGKTYLRDGRTGDTFDMPVTVGHIYMLKLVHLVEDKVHARSTGPYSLITQQPLGGKAQFGGQRFGEMEVWALEAYGAAHILQEILTVKSDDVVGRVKTYEAVVKGENILEPGVPESFKVLVKELQSLGLAVEVLNDEEERIQFVDDTMAGDDSLPELGINLAGFEE
jgi:DNA-directed RNA polymerase subunit beta